MVSITVLSESEGAVRGAGDELEQRHTVEQRA